MSIKNVKKINDDLSKVMSPEALMKSKAMTSRSDKIAKKHGDLMVKTIYSVLMVLEKLDIEIDTKALVGLVKFTFQQGYEARKKEEK